MTATYDINDRFVPFRMANKLKALGFNERCAAFYMPASQDLIRVTNQFRGGYAEDSTYSYNSLPANVMSSEYIDAPLLEQVIEWLVTKDFSISARPYFCEDGLMWVSEVRTIAEYTVKLEHSNTGHLSRNAALLEGAEFAVDVLYTTHKLINSNKITGNE